MDTFIEDNERLRGDYAIRPPSTREAAGEPSKEARRYLHVQSSTKNTKKISALDTEHEEALLQLCNVVLLATLLEYVLQPLRHCQ